MEKFVTKGHALAALAAIFALMFAFTACSGGATEPASETDSSIAAVAETEAETEPTTAEETTTAAETTAEETTAKEETTTQKAATTTKKAATTTKKVVTTQKQTAAAAVVTTRKAATTKKADSAHSRTVYRTKTGSKYHYENPCGNGEYYPVSLDDAIAAGLKPCQKCVLH